MVFRQFIAASKDMEMAPVNESALANYTVMKGSVSATTAPNDKLSGSACQTWKSKGMEDPPIPDAASHPESPQSTTTASSERTAKGPQRSSQSSLCKKSRYGRQL
ncbi:hypothetical protein O3P69_019022 [Scylla paramamosain]|uniref:Uncharacterized protein n=1 Tax=Scylla paramamosain TaxID=85552 RepID=A0AAW0T6V1_SCYPA